jgi:hypothetical protein
MRVRLSSRKRVALALVISGLVPAWCGAQSQPRAEAASPDKTPPGTNSISRRNSLQRLEESLSKSFQSLAPGNSAETFTAPTYYPVPRPATTVSRPRERRKDLLSLSLEELLMPGAPEENKFDLPGEKNGLSGKKSTWELLYEEISRPPSAPTPTKSAKEKEGSLLNKRKTPASSLERESRDDDQEDANIPGGIRSNEKKLKELLADETGRKVLDLPVPARTSVSDFFGIGDTTLTPEEEKAHKDYLDRYRQLLDANSTPPPGTINPLSPLNAFGKAGPAQNVSPYYNLGSLPPTSALAPVPGTPAAMDALLHPDTLPDLNSKVLNQWNPYYVAPKVEPPKPVPFGIPTVQAPRRAF